jgi:hypothetical protein
MVFACITPPLPWVLWLKIGGMVFKGCNEKFAYIFESSFDNLPQQLVFTKRLYGFDCLDLLKEKWQHLVLSLDGEHNMW